MGPSPIAAFRLLAQKGGEGDVIGQRLHGILVVPDTGEEFLFFAKNVGNFVEIAALDNAVSSIVVEA